jgi:hypothetical protein
VVSFTPQPLYRQQKSPWYPLDRITETVIFIIDSNSDSNTDYANLCNNEDFIQKLTDVFGRHFLKLSNLNKSMQSPKFSVLTAKYEVNAFKKKSELWERNTERKIFDMFSTFEICIPSSEREPNKTLFISHVSLLQKQFHCI